MLSRQYSEETCPVGDDKQGLHSFFKVSGTFAFPFLKNFFLSFFFFKFSYDVYSSLASPEHDVLWSCWSYFDCVL